MKSPWSQLNPEFVKGLTSDEIDDVFITSMLWSEEGEDCITANAFAWCVFGYPGLDTCEEIDDKAYECIKKMLRRGLIVCALVEDDKTVTPQGYTVTFADLEADKHDVYEILSGVTTGDNHIFKYLFEITDKGKDFLKENRPKYQSILDELGRLFQEDAADARQNRASHH